MKNTILSILLFAIIVPQIIAQGSDKEMIKETLNYYLDGGTNNDFNILKKAFHETATMKYIGAEGYTEVNAIDFFGRVMKPGPKQNRKTEIVYIDVMGNAAHAKIEIGYPTFAFIDFMNLLKIDGEWKIVSKIFYRDNREE